MIFLDAAATTPVRREVLEAMWPYLSGDFGNPSSHHSLGDAAAAALAGARAATAKALGCRPGEVVFTSGGTEADNLAVKGIALARRAADPRLDRVVISAVEHPAVEESARYLERVHGFAVDVVPVDRYGRVTEEALAAVLRPETALASVMYANNEVGTVQPVARLAALARAQGIPFHTDAVQAAGWLPLDTAALGVDALSISGHKLGAPKGSGALFVRSRTRLEPLIHGGGQERGRRSGTENVAGAVALATALTLAGSSQGAVRPRSRPCGMTSSARCRPACRARSSPAIRASGCPPSRRSASREPAASPCCWNSSGWGSSAPAARPARRAPTSRPRCCWRWASTPKWPRPPSASASTPPSPPPSCRKRRPRSAPPSAASGPRRPLTPRCAIT